MADRAEIKFRKKWPTLPENPTGWRATMTVHLNFGRKGGAATYEIRDPDGRLAPFVKGYNTMEGWNGFVLGEERYRTWAELRKAYEESQK